MRARTSSGRAVLVTLLLLAAARGSSAHPQGPRTRPVPVGPDPGEAELDLTPLEIFPPAIAFGAVPDGETRSMEIVLRNTGDEALELRLIRFLLGPEGTSAAFRVSLNGTSYRGAAFDLTTRLRSRITLAAGQTLTATVTFEPVEHAFDAFFLRFESAQDVAQIAVSGLGGHAGDPFLHVVIDGPSWLVDYDRDGRERVLLDGIGSHTHEPGHELSAYRWRVGGAVRSNTSTLDTVLGLPTSEIELEIFDDHSPPHTLRGSHDVQLVAPERVPGVLAYYYAASASGATALLDALPPAADFVEQRPTMYVGGSGQVGGSPFGSRVLVRLVGQLAIVHSAFFSFTATGGAASRLFVDGEHVIGPVFLRGEHEIEARFAVESLSDLPLDVRVSAGGPGVPIDGDALTHDETGVVPVIHALTEAGALTGGEPITIEGFGFFPPQDAVVHWGARELTAADFTAIAPRHIEFLSPAGGGSVAVTVANRNGTSNVRSFLYQLEGPAPILFHRDLILSVPKPTACVWAPDGRLYVASLDGRITALEFDEDYALVSRATFAGVSGLSNPDTLSLAINPHDPPAPVRLYVGHGNHFVNGGAPPSGSIPYTGQISVLTGPSFATPSPLITGLPVSNHDHGINGLAFDDNGDLFISVGSMTNAGVRDAHMGDLPESPLSAAVLKARLSKPGFNGAITYVGTQSGLPNDDERFGESVDVAPGADVEIQATGFRNAFGLVYTTAGKLYATDNGPNIGFGAAATGQVSESPDPYDDDELDLVEWGNYYGSPNRCRGRTDPRQGVYYAGYSGPPSIPDRLFQTISWLPSSTDGIDEYRANTFQGQLRGNLIVQRYQNRLRRLRMRPDGRGVLSQVVIDPNTFGLACATAPGGAIVSLDFTHSLLGILEPTDMTPVEFVVHDIFPWRAPAGGGTPFVLAGRGLGSLATTMVEIGGRPAELSEVSWGRIRGWIPAEIAPTTALLDVVVRVGSETSVLAAAFRYLLAPGSEPGRWEELASLATPLGEVAAGVIDGTLLLVGESSTETRAYDLQNRQWLPDRAPRPSPGHGHAAEVLGGRLYLLGGLDGGAEGQVQVYDPGSNAWDAGPPLPWSASALATAVIGGKLYAAGGVSADGLVVDACAVLEPATGTWTELAPMPDGGRDHAAAATDGTKLYVFGGRRGGRYVSNGCDAVMVYDLATDEWSWSGDGSSALAPLPEARGGMGKAIYLRGEFYVFGGETLDDPDANADHVYDRVDVYDPLADTWRAEAAMPHPRHGIFPVLYQGHIFLAGGGTQAEFSQSALFDTFTRQ